MSVSVSYGDLGEAAASFQRSIVCAYPVPDAIARLREAIEAADLWVLQEIDPQALLERGGYAIRPARQILFFHPRLMARLLAADPAALIEAPLKFAVIELPDGTVTVRWNDPDAGFARYGNRALSALGRELASVCERIAAGSVAQSATLTTTSGCSASSSSTCSQPLGRSQL